ncbi:unnamed protein product [Echinostoma caproni]|uniref:DUF1336 domain-containing protein n=1 Tax=Echinostoma caproni TaxID=27848 RepID=A0A183AF57_9TREM|nr:unnamed protein product [Echinostoma caproni]
MDDNDYEKHEYFFIQLGEPVLVDKDAQPNLLARLVRRRSTMGSSAPAVEKVAVPDDTNGKKTEQNKSDAVVSQLPDEFIETGKPRLGEWTRIKVNIVESYEFKAALISIFLDWWIQPPLHQSDPRVDLRCSDGE